jgi:hypothetical protein
MESARSSLMGLGLLLGVPVYLWSRRGGSGASGGRGDGLNAKDAEAAASAEIP